MKIEGIQITKNQKEQIDTLFKKNKNKLTKQDVKKMIRVYKNEKI